MDRTRSRRNRSNSASQPHNLRPLASAPATAPAPQKTAPAPQETALAPQKPAPDRQLTTGDVQSIFGHVESIVGQLAPIQSQKDALESFLTIGGVPKQPTKSLKKARAARDRCQKRWNISAEELDSLRPTKGLGGESYYRALYELSGTAEGRGWERARLLLLAARDTRTQRVERGISADVSVSVTDVKAVLSSLSAPGYASPLAIFPSPPPALTCLRQISCRTCRPCRP